MENRMKNTLIVISVIIISLITIYGFDVILTVPRNNTVEKINFKLRKQVMPSATAFDESQKVESNGIYFIPGFDENKTLLGYVVYDETSGFASKISFLMGVDLSGRITGLKILDASKETQGLGSKVENKEWESLWEGRDSEYTFDKELDALSGATITPKSVYLGIKKILGDYDSVKPESNSDSGDNQVLKAALVKDKSILDLVQKIFPQAVAYDANIQNISGMKFISVFDSQNKHLGYFVSLKTDGVEDMLSFDMGISLDGKVVKLSNIDIGRNALTYNELIKSQKWIDSWTGKDKTYKFDENLDSQGGASISPRSIYGAMNKALKVSGSLKKSKDIVTNNGGVGTKNTNNSKAAISLLKDEKIVSRIQKIFSNAQSYEATMPTVNGIKIILTYDSEGKLLGYFTTLTAEGVEDNLTFDLGIGTDGKIVKMSAVNIGENIPDYNELVTDQKWQSSWIGRDKNYKFNEKTDAEAGASISPKVIYGVINKALKASGTLAKPVSTMAAKAVTKVTPEKKVVKVEVTPSVEKDEKILTKIKTIYPEVASYSSNIPKISGIKFILVYDSSDKKLGYFTSLIAEGVEGPLSFDLGIGMDGKIIKLTNLNIGDNSRAYNRIVQSKLWQSYWTGKDGNYKFDEEIDSQAGASVSPKVIFDTMMKAVKVSAKIKGGN